VTGPVASAASRRASATSASWTKTWWKSATPAALSTATSRVRAPGRRVPEAPLARSHADSQDALSSEAHGHARCGVLPGSCELIRERAAHTAATLARRARRRRLVAARGPRDGARRAARGELGASLSLEISRSHLPRRSPIVDGRNPIPCSPHRHAAQTPERPPSRHIRRRRAIVRTPPPSLSLFLRSSEDLGLSLSSRFASDDENSGGSSSCPRRDPLASSPRTADSLRPLARPQSVAAVARRRPPERGAGSRRRSPNGDLVRRASRPRPLR